MFLWDVTCVVWKTFIGVSNEHTTYISKAEDVAGSSKTQYI
jgi:hypothetical protein